MSTSIAPEEKEKIQFLLPRSQKLIQIVFRAKVRFEKKYYDEAICTLSSHYLGFFVPSKSNDDFEYHNVSHISVVTSILFKDNWVIIGMGKKNLRIQSEFNLKFSQLLYRNLYLSYFLLEPKDDIEFVFDGEQNEEEKENLFPPIVALPISPSQQFQFNYFANCTDEERARYNHDAVRYVHNMLTTKNTIFDISMLPYNLINRKNAKENLRQIFAPLSIMKTVSGIVLSNYEYPDVISTFSSLIPNLTSLRIVHLSKCGATTGLDDLAEAIIKANKLNVSYWDLSYNKFKNFKPFATIISNSKKPIQYINLNYCDISNSGSTAFFNALSKFDYVEKLHYLSIAKMSLSDNTSIAAFRHFLQVSQLYYIDLSSMEEEISAVLKVLTEEEQPKLRSLILNKLPLDDGPVFHINELIKKSNSLEELSLSESNISLDNLASIITTINENKNINSFSLNLNNTKINRNLQIILDAFSAPAGNNNRKKSKSKKKGNDEDNDEDNYNNNLKWKKLSFASNSLGEEDLDNLINVIENFQNLSEINLDDNFNSAMEGIEDTLCRLAELESLDSISIAGSAKNKNSRLKSKLVRLLTKLADSGSIKKLDISNNDINDISCIKKLVKKCKNLTVFRFDGNGCTDLEETIDTIIKIKKLTEFNFPIKDCKKWFKNNDKPDAEKVEDIEILMRDLMKVVNKNREKDLYCELPFKTSDDVEDLIYKLSSKARENIEKFYQENPIEHSFVTEIFRLPFPFQKISMLTRDERDKGNIFLNSQVFYDEKNLEQYGEIQQCKVRKQLSKCYYAQQSMKDKFVEYFGGLYPEFVDNYIYNGAIKDFFDNINQSQDKEIENKSTKVTQSKNKNRVSNNDGKIMERSLKITDESENDQNYDESNSEVQQNLNKTQKYLIKGKDNQAEDEKTRIQFRNADVREVEDLSLNLQTGYIDNDKLDRLVDSSYEQVKETRKIRSNVNGTVSRSSRTKDNENLYQDQEKASLSKASNEKRSRVDNRNNNNNNNQPRQLNVDDDSDKDKSIIMKKKKILQDTAYANSSSDDEHIEKIRRQNLRGNGKRKSNPQPPPQQQHEHPKQKSDEKETDDDQNEQQQKRSSKKKKRTIVPSTDSSSSVENKPIPRKNMSDNENDDDNDEMFPINKRRKVINRSTRPQQVSTSSSDSENNEDETNKRRKRSSNSQQIKQQQQIEDLKRRKHVIQQEVEEEEEDQERLRQDQEDQEILRQQERRRQYIEQQQQQQQEEDKQQKMKKKQTPPPPSKKSQSLKDLLSSSTDELSNNEEEKSKLSQKKNPQSRKPIQKPPNPTDPGSAMVYANNLLEETEKKPRPSKIPKYRKT